MQSGLRPSSRLVRMYNDIIMPGCVVCSHNSQLLWQGKDKESIHPGWSTARQVEREEKAKDWRMLPWDKCSQYTYNLLAIKCAMWEVLPGSKSIMIVSISRGSMGRGYRADHVTQMSPCSIPDNLTKLELLFDHPRLIGRSTCRNLKDLGLYTSFYTIEISRVRIQTDASSA